MKHNWIKPIERWTGYREVTSLPFAFDEAGRPIKFPQGLHSSHSLLLGRNGIGKRTLLSHLVRRYLKDGLSLAVLDATGELVDTALELIPEKRMAEVIYVDLGNKDRLIQFNPLQVGIGLDPDVIVSSLVSAARRLWHKYWDMDVEGLVTFGLTTLVSANQERQRRGEPQFTLVDLVKFLDSSTFRRRILNRYVPHPLLSYFWMGGYERAFLEERPEPFMDCYCLLRNSILHANAQRILGQSASALGWHPILNSRFILLIKTAARGLQNSLEQLPAACLLEQLLSAIRIQRTNAEHERKKPLPIFVNDEEPLVYPDRSGMLAELKRLRVMLTFSTSFLARLDSGLTPFSRELLDSEPNLFLFSPLSDDIPAVLPGWSADDWPRRSSDESDLECYIRRRASQADLSLEWMRMSPASQGNPAIAAQLMKRSLAYTRFAEEIEAEREQFDEEWQAEERQLLHMSFDQKSSGSEPGDDNLGIGDGEVA